LWKHLRDGKRGRNPYLLMSGTLKVPILPIHHLSTLQVFQTIYHHLQQLSREIQLSSEMQLLSCGTTRVPRRPTPRSLTPPYPPPAPGIPPVNPSAPGMVGPGMLMDKKMRKKMKKVFKNLYKHQKHGKHSPSSSSSYSVSPSHSDPPLLRLSLSVSQK
uniref:Uncharacterized protein n=1 Tax=Suricata suricatta TaxID=37032 RepID=A0A673UBM1_SURSU